MDYNMPPTLDYLQNTLPEMNPAGISQVQSVATHQGKMLAMYQKQVAKLYANNEHLM